MELGDSLTYTYPTDLQNERGENLDPVVGMSQILPNVHTSKG